MYLKRDGSEILKLYLANYSFHRSRDCKQSLQGEGAGPGRGSCLQEGGGIHRDHFSLPGQQDGREFSSCSSWY